MPAANFSHPFIFTQLQTIVPKKSWGRKQPPIGVTPKTMDNRQFLKLKIRTQFPLCCPLHFRANWPCEVAPWRKRSKNMGLIWPLISISTWGFSAQFIRRMQLNPFGVFSPSFLCSRGQRRFVVNNSCRGKFVDRVFWIRNLWNVLEFVRFGVVSGFPWPKNVATWFKTKNFWTKMFYEFRRVCKLVEWDL